MDFDNIFYILPPCLILFALDLALRHVTTGSLRQPSPSTSSPGTATTSVVPSTGALQRLDRQAQQVLSDFKELETEFLRVQTHNHALSLEVARCRALTQAGPTSSQRPRSGSAPAQPNHRKRTRGTSPEFDAFCEKLLDANRAWAQERAEITRLKGALKASSESHRAACFKAMCDQMVFEHKLRQERKRVAALQEECERTRRKSISMVTGAALQKVLDDQKERMVEVFVEDVLKEAAEARRSLSELRAQHEREIQEMARDWRNENRQLREEVERLRLGQQAKALEQDISNELEARLLSDRDALKAQSSPRPHTSLQLYLEGRRDDEIEGYGSDTETYCEEMSTLSSTSTRVASPHSSRYLPKKPRARLSYGDISIFKPEGRRRFRWEDYAGFSFNPLFFSKQLQVSHKTRSSIEAPARRVSEPLCLNRANHWKS